MKVVFRLLFAAFAIFMIGCSSSDVKDAIDDIRDVVDEPDRKPIDKTRMGLNAFANNSSFGSISTQYNQVYNTLGLKYVRILFAWNDAVQSTPGSSPNFSFYDNILAGMPSGMRALVVVTGVPSWMSDSSNWVDGNPRKTFVRQWFKKVLQRYGGSSKIMAFQVWNEPNMTANADNVLLQMDQSAANYVEMVAFARNQVDNIAPSKLLVSAATTAIAQNYPGSKNYNENMRDAGIQTLIDVYGVHYYGKQFENVVRNGGVADFLNGISKPIWITESGAQGVDNQLPYVEQIWPYLREKVPGIDLIFYYQFTEATPSDVTYGLRNLDPNFPVSNLYIHLRDG